MFIVVNVRVDFYNTITNTAASIGTEVYRVR
jgi:hypothetical protein